uniref:Uncharacterized protein n=1 Tax=Anguilla anguilla TaxID=7936 RepID=A0A0E9PGJ7_ANGAN
MTCVLPFFFRLRENGKNKNEIDEYLWAT